MTSGRMTIIKTMAMEQHGQQSVCTERAKIIQDYVSQIALIPGEFGLLSVANSGVSAIAIPEKLLQSPTW